MDNQIHKSGERVEKFCAVCGVERGHVVASVSKAGRITRVSCPKCGTLSTFKLSARTTLRPQRLDLTPYDRTRTYRAGQSMLHETYGTGEVTALVEPRKIDVLFPDRLRRLVHAQQ